MKWTRIDLVEPGGSLWLMVDPPTLSDSRDSRRVVPFGWPATEDYTGQVVHLISDYARGEIRGYVLIDGVLWYRFPRPILWPEMDVLVCRALGVPVPESMADPALAASTVRLAQAPDGGLRLDVATGNTPAQQAFTFAGAL